MSNSNFPPFKELSQLLQTVLGIEEETFGTVDIAVHGKDLPLLKAQLESALEKKLKVFQTVKMPNTTVTLFGRKYGLNTRDDEHITIHALGMLLRMTMTEMEKSGSVQFYNLSALNEANPYILRLFKTEQEGINPDAAFEKFRTQFEAFADMPADEFKNRLEELKASNFIIDKNTDKGVAQWYPTAKTLRIDTI